MAKSSKSSSKSAEKAAAEGNEQVQERIDAENEQGYRGTKVDPTPNDAYTLQGVVEGQPTPETDEEAFRAAQGATRGNPFTGAASTEDDK